MYGYCQKDTDRFWVYALILLALLLLIAVKFTPFGASAGGATRWFKIGWLKFQPSELARFSMVIFLACSVILDWIFAACHYSGYFCRSHSVAA